MAMIRRNRVVDTFLKPLVLWSLKNSKIILQNKAIKTYMK